MDLDTSSLWSWTVPLWGLFVIVLFLGGVLTDTAILEGIAPPLKGGAINTAKRVRFSLRPIE